MLRRWIRHANTPPDRHLFHQCPSDFSLLPRGIGPRRYPPCLCVLSTSKSTVNIALFVNLVSTLLITAREKSKKWVASPLHWWSIYSLHLKVYREPATPSKAQPSEFIFLEGCSRDEGGVCASCWFRISVEKMQQKSCVIKAKVSISLWDLELLSWDLSKDTIVIRRERQAAHRQMCNYRDMRVRNLDGGGQRFRAQIQTA